MRHQTNKLCKGAGISIKLIRGWLHVQAPACRAGKLGVMAQNVRGNKEYFVGDGLK